MASHLSISSLSSKAHLSTLRNAKRINQLTCIAQRNKSFRGEVEKRKERESSAHTRNVDSRL